jgi:4-hydroxybenzoate polyprenyltransferase
MTDSERPHRPEFVDDPPPRAGAGSRGSTLLAYLQLFRAPNVFTAIADVAMGFFITTNSLAQWPGFALLICTSALLYTAGMVLNDVFDLEVDRVERPSRPLPSGRVSWQWARWLGFQMLLVGTACGWLAGAASNIALGPSWRSGLVASLLASMVLLYDGCAKRTAIGPLVMGSCRSLNVLLGMSLNAAVITDEPQWIGFGTSHFMIAGGIGLYIVGVTCFARSEATTSPRGLLTLGVLVMAAGIALLALFPRWHLQSFAYRLEPTTTWPMALAMISIWILRRAILAIGEPSPARVQAAVKNCILSLIMLDATVCILVCDLAYGVGIVLLLIPTLLVARWVYST